MKLRDRPSDGVQMGQAIRETPRLDGEDIVAWMDRVCSHAGLDTAGQEHRRGRDTTTAAERLDAIWSAPLGREAGEEG